MMKESIEMIWKEKDTITNISKNREVYEIVGKVISELDEGRLRVCEKRGGVWHVNDWIKKAILIYFLIERTQEFCSGYSYYYDKVAPKFLRKSEGIGPRFRSVPPSMVRRGSFISEGAVLMPSFVNIGAFVGEKTMIDAWSTIGSCAQVGRNVHISGGVGIGGVLEPISARPVIIEDNCFIGARSEIVEGVIVEANSVVSMGVFIGQSTRIYDREADRIEYGRIPSNSVVVPGCLMKDKKYGLNCAVIVKRTDARTKTKTEINELLRPQ